MTLKHAKHITLTGGPCAGKTTALTYLYDHLSALGWRVVLVPEAATLVMGSTGRRPEDRTPAFFQAAQTAILTLQRDFPAVMGNTIDQTSEKVVFLYDRAELDNRAYVTDDVFEPLVQATHGKTIWEIADSYDAVIHMITAADGAESAYTLANNEARTETPAQAIELDEATRRAWLGHAHYTVVNNEGTFDSKLVRTLQAVLHVLGEPEPVEVERKWVLSSKPDISTLNATPVYIEQYYLNSPAEDGSEMRVRARRVGDHTTYYRTVKKLTSDLATRIEHERIISVETYNELLAYRKPGTAAVRKTRWCFVHEGQHFELDHVREPRSLWLLEAELVQPDQEVVLPPLGPMREVTGNSEFSNAHIAQTAS